MLSRLRARLFGSAAPSDADIDRELRDHLELEAESLAASGNAAPEDARFTAHRRFGNVTRAHESVRDV